MSNWVVGYNMPGYLPEADVWITADWEAARLSLIDDMERHADQDAEIGNDASDYDSAIADLKAVEPNTEWGWTVGDLAYWLSATDEPEEEEE